MYLGLLDESARLPADYWERRIPDGKRFEVELGPGTCQFVLESARADPDTVFVGLEIQERVVRRALVSGDIPPNTLLCHVDGGWVVEHILAETSIDAFHLYFPDPWWKKKHHKRRLITPVVAEAIARTLKPGGCLYLVTDVAPLFKEIRDHLTAAQLVEAPWRRDPECPGQSSYERKYRAQGRTLYERRFEKPAAAELARRSRPRTQAMALAGD